MDALWVFVGAGGGGGGGGGGGLSGEFGRFSCLVGGHSFIHSFVRRSLLHPHPRAHAPTDCLPATTLSWR